MTRTFPYRVGNRIYYRCEHWDYRGRCAETARQWVVRNPRTSTEVISVCSQHAKKYPVRIGKDAA